MKRKYVGLSRASVLGIILVGAGATSVYAQHWMPKGPVPRAGHSAVFDASTDKMIVFGGIPDGPTNLNDTFWLLSAVSAAKGSAWQAVNPTGTLPAPRVGHTAVLDSPNSRMIVFGGALGRSSPCSNDVWVLRNANGVSGAPGWSQTMAGGSQPAPRLRHTAVYDSVSNRMIVFGGADCFSTFYNDVWVLTNANGLTGTPVWSELSISGPAPSPRASQAAVYDAVHNVMTIFGGYQGSILFNEVWVLSNANGIGGVPTWTQLNPAGSPSPRSDLPAVYDAANNRMTIFGGGTANGLVNDIWILSGANGIGTPVWTEVQASGTPAPAPRGSHSAIYDSLSNSMVIFGGLIDSASIPISDVFVLRHANGL